MFSTQPSLNIQSGNNHQPLIALRDVRKVFKSEAGAFQALKSASGLGGPVEMMANPCVIGRGLTKQIGRNCTDVVIRFHEWNPTLGQLSLPRSKVETQKEISP